MNAREFERAGIRLYGKKHWKVLLARALDRHPSMIWRYATGQQSIPLVIELAIKSLLSAPRA